MRDKKLLNGIRHYFLSNTFTTFGIEARSDAYPPVRFRFFRLNNMQNITFSSLLIFLLTRVFITVKIEMVN